jgi:hypothetical protein
VHYERTGKRLLPTLVKGKNQSIFTVSELPCEEEAEGEDKPRLRDRIEVDKTFRKSDTLTRSRLMQIASMMKTVTENPSIHGIYSPPKQTRQNHKSRSVEKKFRGSSPEHNQPRFTVSSSRPLQRASCKVLSSSHHPAFAREEMFYVKSKKKKNRAQSISLEISERELSDVCSRNANRSLSKNKNSHLAKNKYSQTDTNQKGHSHRLFELPFSFKFDIGNIYISNVDTGSQERSVPVFPVSRESSANSKTRKPLSNKASMTGSLPLLHQPITQVANSTIIHSLKTVLEQKVSKNSSQNMQFRKFFAK